jgi:DNA repair exonuclease SbcCD ATPase subunit
MFAHPFASLTVPPCPRYDCHMKLEAHFFSIHKVIIDHLSAAQFEIAAAVAWFTDHDIFEMLCKKARLGVKVSVILIGDEINQGPGRLNLARLGSLGGQVVFLAPGSATEPTMHHKFCVIDRATVITGSYNWSRKARSNDENITVVTDAEAFARNYLDAFEDLLARAGYVASETTTVDSESVRRRLELIRNLVLLGEQDELTLHIRKLHPASEAIGLGRLIAALDRGEYAAALKLIEDYLHRATALVVADAVDIAPLRFELSVLELRLESLSDEKAELDRRLITFNRRNDEALGGLIQRLLRARAQLARLVAFEQIKSKEREEAEAEVREAEEDYADYSRQHEELRKVAPLPSLSEDEERELKAIYRKACGLCHPDKFPEEQKEAATKGFIDLQAAYEGSDLARVRKIHDMLAAGGLPATRSTTLHEADRLKAAIAELERTITRMAAELIALHSSDAYRHLEAAGASEADWQNFFERQRVMLEAELARVESQILARRKDEEGPIDLAAAV